MKCKSSSKTHKNGGEEKPRKNKIGQIRQSLRKWRISIEKSKPCRFGTSKTPKPLTTFFPSKFYRILLQSLMIRSRHLFLSARAFFGHRHGRLLPSEHRWISSTAQLNASWMDKIKGVFTGKKTSPDAASTSTSADPFTLLRKLLPPPYWDCL